VSRTGWGYDVHRFGGEGPLVLCGVLVDEGRGLLGTSDADVATHAVIDALLGAAAMGDIGQHFPSSDERWQGADSVEMLRVAAELLRAAGHTIEAVDVTILVESVRIAPRRDEMRTRLAAAMLVAVSSVSVKATSTDGLGFVGRDEGIAAAAVATIA
jgi:2-C-methyl-D-erythritol 4-phosphate cytidylyltransferase / 2-C-methyl-D-erythritol 2,4-cyclodiphosphate synthase